MARGRSLSSSSPLILALSLCSCGANAPAPPVASVVVPPGPSAAVSEQPVIAPAPLPEFLDLTRVMDSSLRGRIGAIGPAYEERDGELANAGGDDLPYGDEVPVLEPGGHDVRARILSEKLGFRVALFIDPDVLAIVALHGAVLVADSKSPLPANDLAPGVRFVAGTMLSLIITADKKMPAMVLEVSYQDGDISMTGFVARDEIGSVYPSEPALPKDTGDFEMPRGGELFDAPAGKSLAKIQPPGSTRLVRSLGRKEHGYMLVRYTTPDLAAVGWARAVDLRPKTTVRVVSPSVKMGKERAAPSRVVSLTRGTLLGSLPSGDRIGVMTIDRAVECLAACSTGEPTVRVQTVLGDVDVKVIPQRR